mmetsp:Transcript_20987/g.45631  ORF Transcript_20987/g.45631 Transcript_20987/m.45631 type:complete len:279 (+) Transcript_20987:1223-2059(+)
MFRYSFQPFNTTTSAVVVESGISQKDGPQGIGKATHEKLFKFEAATQCKAQISGQSKVGRQSKKLLFMIVEKFVAILVRSLGAETSIDSGPHTTSKGCGKVGDTVSNDLVELSSKDCGCFCFLFCRCLQTLDQFQHMGVASSQTLPNNLEGSCHNIGTFDGNGDRQTHVSIAQVVVVASTNRRTSGNIHSAFYDATTALGAVLLHDGRNHHRRFVVVDNSIHQVSSSDCNQCITAGKSHCFLNSTKLGNGNTELLAGTCVGSDSRNNTAPSTNRTSRQ